MSSTETELDTVHPEPSQELLAKIELANDIIQSGQMWYEKAKDAVYAAYQQALQDGFTPKQAGDFIRKSCNVLCERTVRQILPKEAKYQEKIRTLSENTEEFAARVPQTESVTETDEGQLEPEIVAVTSEGVKTSSETFQDYEELKRLHEDLKNDVAENYVHKDFYNSAREDLDDLKLENEQIKAEANKQVKEAIESANTIAAMQRSQGVQVQDVKPKEEIETVEGLKLQIAELQEIINNNVKVEFNTASVIESASTATRIEFPVSLFGKFFAALQKSAGPIFLKVSADGKVEGWE